MQKQNSPPKNSKKFPSITMGKKHWFENTDPTKVLL